MSPEEMERQLQLMRQMIERQNEVISRLEKKLDEAAHTEVPPLVVPVSSGPTDARPVTPDELHARIDQAIQKYDAENSGRMLPKGVQTGYDSGFFITSQEGIKIGDLDVPFLLKLRARLNFRHSYFDSDGPNPDENDFELERARIYWLGYFLRPYLEYQITLDGDEDGSTGSVETVGVYDWIISYTFSEPLGWECAEMGIRFGKWKSPLFRQETESSGRQQFAERSMVNEFFNIDRNSGVTLFGSFDLLGRPFEWEAGLINGFNTTELRPSRAGHMDNDLAFVSKTYWDVIGEWGDEEQSDLSYHCCPAVRVGTSFGIQRTDAVNGPLEAALPRVADTGATLISILPAGVTEWTDARYGFDWGIKYRGWSLNNEFYFRNIYDFAGADVDDLFDWGYYTQLGYFIVPKKLELAARYSTVIGDSSTLGGSEHSGDEVAGTINWYIRGHNLKFQLDVSHYNGAVLSSSSGNFRAMDEGLLFRSQVQIYY